MIDVLIIAVVVCAVVLAARSIFKSFSTQHCAGCAQAHGCSHGQESCPAANATIERIDHISAQLGKQEKSSANSPS